ncbi:MAG: pre-peptidase C-terminal domain-containing protein [Pirellulales bacterium]|nr:pre-peptidase C-terminal domain-containing protein [Pirellulales bacterium]
MIRTSAARQHLSVLGIGIACFLLASHRASAQLPRTELTSVFPPGGKQGSSFEVKTTGKDLDGAEGLLFSHPKIKGKTKVATPEHLMTPRHVDDAFEVSIAPDVPPGIYEVRVVGRHGTSNPRAFCVGTFAEAVAEGKNRSLKSAQSLPIGTTVNGTCIASGVDYYQLSLKANQRVLIECMAHRIDSRMDATLIIYDGNGNELARDRDTTGLDPLVDFTAPADGDYFIGVYDYLYRGGSEYFYRLTTHAGPHVDFVFPPSGVPGSSGSYTVFGRNLPGGKRTESMTIEGVPLESTTTTISLPTRDAVASSDGVAGRVDLRSALVDGFDFRLGNANPVRVGLATAPVVVEQPDNDTPQTAQKVTLPCEYVGQFYPARDEDWIEFEAKKGDVFVIDVISHRLGLESDPALLIQRVVRKNNGEPAVSDFAAVDDPADRATRIGTDFDTSTDDPQYRFRVPMDATYRIMVRDQFGDSRNDARYVYRLVIRQQQPDFRLVAMPRGAASGGKKNNNQVMMDPPVIPKSGAAMVHVTVDRRDGFDGEIELTVEGLPGDIQCPGAVVAGNSTKALLMLSTTKDTKPWSGPITITGKAKIDGRDVVRSARGGSIVWGTNNRQQSAPVYRVTRDMVVSVSQGVALPASIRLGESPVIETSLGGKLSIPVRVQRTGDFKSDLKMTAAGLPKEIKPKDINLKGAASEAKLELSITNASTKPGTYTCYLQADTKHKMVRDPSAVAIAEKDVSEVREVLTAVENEIKQVQGDDDAAKKRLKELQDKKKRVESAKKAIEKKMADAKNNSKPKDMNLSLVSTPVVIKIAPAPFELNTKSGSVSGKQDSAIEVPFQLTKKFGFDDKVSLSLRPPSGVAGVSAGSVSVDKGKNDATVKLKLAKNATPGEHKLTIRAESRFNNVTVRTETPLLLKVDTQ